MKNPPHYPLADVARYQGDGVAVVIAESRAQAKDAAELVEVDYEPLDAVVDVEKALEDGAPLVHPDLGTNECYVWRLDTDATGQAIEDADVVVTRTLLPAAADPERDRAARRARRARPDGDVTLYSATQVPHILRVLAAASSACPRRSCASSRPTSAAASARSSTSTRRSCSPSRSPAGSGGPCKWTEERSENYRRDDPRPRRRYRVHARRDEGRDDHALPGAGDGGDGRVPPARHAGHPAARRVDLRRRRTRSRTTASSSRASSRTRRRPTPTAAPGAPRRRT